MTQAQGLAWLRGPYQGIFRQLVSMANHPYACLPLTPPSTYPIKEDFLRAAESQGIPTVDDLQDLSTGHGAEHWLKWINRDVRHCPSSTRWPTRANIIVSDRTSQRQRSCVYPCHPSQALQPLSCLQHQDRQGHHGERPRCGSADAVSAAHTSLWTTSNLHQGR